MSHHFMLCGWSTLTRGDQSGNSFRAAVSVSIYKSFVESNVTNTINSHVMHTSSK